ncbi:hypothetical protein SMU21_03810 [Streptococcus mutans 1SM1]|nr:hypothetical protein SMU21_03810 [Streptococcus mutans 1SM1]
MEDPFLIGILTSVIFAILYRKSTRNKKNKFRDKKNK